MTDAGMRIVISGYMIRYPLAGNLFAFFHYVLGFHQLGHEVIYVEESGWPSSCYDPAIRSYGDDPRAGIGALESLLVRHRASVPIIYVERASRRVFGADWDGLKRTLRAADLWLNVGGVCWLEEFRLCPRRAFVDMDPLFTQLGVFGAEALREHHVHFSYGSNVGRAGCTIPTLGLEWIPTYPPVVSALWQDQSAAPENPALTTVAHWNAYKSVHFAGERYGHKNEEFERILGLPARVHQRLELALTGAGPHVKRRLEEAGWCVRDAFETSGSVAGYSSYVTSSRGEFSVAKNAYVKARTGWFSDRSVCYLAAGRPVILQETGFSDAVPTGSGLLAFRTLDEACACIERVNSEYEVHRRAARALARQTFDHRIVLPRLLQSALRAAA